MKFKISHDPANKALSIPYAALQLSGLAGADDLALHAADGCVLLLPENPNTAELLKTICLLSDLAPRLIFELAARSQQIMEAEMEETACGGCDADCDGLSIPPCQLAEAGIGVNTALEAFVENGRVIVQAAEKTDADRLIDSLDKELREILEDSDVQMEGVCRLLEDEGYRHE